MWAYLFWSLVAAWLFSLRPKRDREHGTNETRAQRYGEHRSSGQCGHSCCHAHDQHAIEHSGIRYPNVDPEIHARKEQNWSEAHTDLSFEGSERGSVSNYTQLIVITR
jgi:hypothetical protein